MTNEQRPKRGFQTELIVGISAIVVGVCALGVSLYEAHLMRQEQRAAVIPLIELSRSYYLDSENPSSSRARLQLYAENVGIGPARILDFRVTVDGIPRASWDAAMRALLGRDESIAYGQTTINGRTIPPERNVRMFDLNDNELAAPIVAEFDRLDFQACFCSIFDECWTTRYSTFGAAIPVAACTGSDDSFQE